MRWRGLMIGGWLVAGAGCLSPFSWPDDRPAFGTAAANTVDDSAARADESSAEDALTRAADCLDRGDEAAALPHLRAHVTAHPDAVMIRAHLAELLFRLGQSGEARGQFERFVADAQEVTGPANAHLVHCHTRLMAIAEAGDDSFHEHLHRGIGLLLLVKRWDADPTRHDDAAAEQTLAKAVAAFRAAKDERPTDPRVHLYLGDALTRLGQPSAARAAYRAARAALPDPSATPAERSRIEATAGG